MTADAFNAAHPIGIPVTAYPCFRDCPDHAPQTTRTRSTAWTLGGHTPVVLIEGLSGAIALSHIDVITNEEPA